MRRFGDLYTGKDRSYTRSIYMFVRDINETVGEYVVVAYAGRLIMPRKAYAYNSRRDHDEFRVPTQKELDDAGYSPLIKLIHLLHKLDIATD